MTGRHVPTARTSVGAPSTSAPHDVAAPTNAARTITAAGLIGFAIALVLVAGCSKPPSLTTYSGTIPDYSPGTGPVSVTVDGPNRAGQPPTMPPGVVPGDAVVFPPAGAAATPLIVPPGRPVPDAHTVWPWAFASAKP